MGNDPLNAIDPWGLDRQYGITLGGTLAFYVLGVGASATVGISVPDNPSNLGGYQGFFSPQVNGMGGAGAYAGWGMSFFQGSSKGPLPIFSANTSGYAEFDIGAGPSLSISGQGNQSGLSGWSFSPIPKIGEGYGIWVGVGGQASATFATPTVAQSYDLLRSIFGGQSSDANLSPALAGGADASTGAAIINSQTGTSLPDSVTGLVGPQPSILGGK